MMVGPDDSAYALSIEQMRGELAHKQQFTMMVAHEMRNLLAPLLYEVQLLTRDDTAPSAIYLRPVIGRQLAQMGRLVDDLLDVACSEHGQLSLRIASLDLREVIAAAIEVAQPAIAAQKHHLTLAPEPPSVVIDGDRYRLTQVLSNLLINAAKFTPQGGEICVSLERETQYAKVGIRDTGVGIAVDMLPRIFDTYVRAVPAPEAASGGLGLGLAIARHLVELHGGTLCANSAGPGRGSEFVMRLPLL